MFEPKPLHISQLEVQHPQYALHAPTWRSIAALIEGYTAVRGNTERFLPRRPGEDDELYQLRAAKLAYTPLMSGVVNRYAGKMSGSEIVAKDGLDPRIGLFRLSNNAPGLLKRSEKNLIGEIFRQLLQYSRVWATVDTNVLDFVPKSAYEESLVAANLRPFCRIIDPLTVTQWGDGWHIERRWVNNTAPFEPVTSRMVYCYHDSTKILKYSAEVRLATLKDDEGNNYHTVSHVKVGGTWEVATDPKAMVQPSEVAYRSAPIYSTISVVLPDEQWLCKQLYSKQIQHLQLETSWTDAGYLAGTIQRVFTPIDAPPIDDARTPYEAPDYTAELAKAGNAHILVAKGYQFVESTGTAIGNQQGMLDKIEAQINHLAALHFASSGKSALQQSGASKRMDMSLLDDALKEYGDSVMTVYNAIIDLVCMYLGVDDKDVLTGLDEFNSLDLDTVANLLATTATLPSYPQEMLLALYNKLMELAKIDVQVNSLPQTAVDNLRKDDT